MLFLVIFPVCLPCLLACGCSQRLVLTSLIYSHLVTFNNKHDISLVNYNYLENNNFNNSLVNYYLNINSNYDFSFFFDYYHDIFLPDKLVNDHLRDC